jgi:opacity protein-like surface antigen
MFIATAIATSLATGALAGAADVVVAAEPEVLETAAPATDWNGFYAGGMATSDGGDFDYFLNGTYDTTFAMEGDMYGVFAGYNVQRGAMVYGGEIAYSTGSVFLTGFPTYEFSSMVDVKARVGYAAGNALMYAVVGGSFGPWDNGFDSNYAMSGINFGAGVDLLVTDSIFIGGEYLMRSLTGDAGNGVNSYEANMQSIQIRAGTKF